MILQGSTHEPGVFYWGNQIASDPTPKFSVQVTIANFVLPKNALFGTSWIENQLEKSGLLKHATVLEIRFDTKTLSVIMEPMYYTNGWNPNPGNKAGWMHNINERGARFNWYREQLSKLHSNADGKGFLGKVNITKMVYKCSGRNRALVPLQLNFSEDGFYSSDQVLGSQVSFRKKYRDLVTQPRQATPIEEHLVQQRRDIIMLMEQICSDQAVYDVSTFNGDARSQDANDADNMFLEEQLALCKGARSTVKDTKVSTSTSGLWEVVNAFDWDAMYMKAKIRSPPPEHSQWH
jgi:hypothetical protein